MFVCGGCHHTKNPSARTDPYQVLFLAIDMHVHTKTHAMWIPMIILIMSIYTALLPLTQLVCSLLADGRAKDVSNTHTTWQAESLRPHLAFPGDANETNQAELRSFRGIQPERRSKD